MPVQPAQGRSVVAPRLAVVGHSLVSSPLILFFYFVRDFCLGARDRLAAVGLKEASDKVAMLALGSLEVVLVHLCTTVHQHLHRLE